MTKRPPLRHVLIWPEHGVEMAFRRIPKGSFRMGSRGCDASEEPIHRVTISEDFWMADTPVTQAQFAIWTQAEGIDHKNEFDGRADNPAESMDWHQAVAYCAWLTETKSADFPAGFFYRFATERSSVGIRLPCRDRNGVSQRRRRGGVGGCRVAWRRMGRWLDASGGS
jgi:formylglycine-generating enzyme required for sulfatase activity